METARRWHLFPRRGQKERGVGIWQISLGDAHLLYEFSLPTKADAVPTGPDWLHEVKYDGFRMMVARNRIDSQLISWKRRFEGSARVTVVAVPDSADPRGTKLYVTNLPPKPGITYKSIPGLAQPDTGIRRSAIQSLYGRQAGDGIYAVH